LKTGASIKKTKQKTRSRSNRPHPQPLIPSTTPHLSPSPNVAFDLADASTITPSSAPPATIPTEDRAGAAGIRADRDAASRARGSGKARRAFSNDLARRKVATQPAGLDAQRPAPEAPAGGPTSHVADPALMPDAWGGAAEDEWGTPPPGWPGNKRAPVTAASPYAARRLTYTQLWQLVAEGKVASVSIDADGGGCTATLAASAPGGSRTERVGLPYDPALLDHLAAHGVVVETAPPPPWLLQALGFATQALFPMAFSVGLAWLVLQSLKIGGAGAAVGGDSNAADIFAGPELRRLDKGEAGVDFSDVAGIDAVKAEVFEIVEFLRNPARFMRVGARSPAGVLLAGVPGTGKTLLARAVAGEAGVPFFSTAGSDFMEAFVGMGASRVRDVFQAARAAAPCVLFIDEFDGIGAARTTAAGVSEGKERDGEGGMGWSGWRERVGGLHTTHHPPLPGEDDETIRASEPLLTREPEDEIEHKWLNFLQLSRLRWREGGIERESGQERRHTSAPHLRPSPPLTFPPTTIHPLSPHNNNKQSPSKPSTSC
jgi:hypothetical protein